MAHLLYHWRLENYLRDLDMGVGFHLNQKSPVLHQIEKGDSLWAFTRFIQPGGSLFYALAARLVCHGKTKNPDGFRYGLYRVYGDLERSRYFRVVGQPNITPLIRGFPLATGQDSTPLGQAFQGNAAVRVIGEDQHLALLEWSKDFEVEPRAQLLPEDILERQDDFVLSGLSSDLGFNTSMSEARRQYLLTKSRTRRGVLVTQLKDMYDGRCQISGWNPRAEFGRDLCEAHHIQWLSRGGEDEMSNLILVSPNIHRMIHALDAPFDYQELAFRADLDVDIKIKWIDSSHKIIPNE